MPMIPIKSSQEIGLIREAGKRLCAVLDQVKTKIVVGVSTLELDAVIARLLKQSELVSQSKGYMGYKHVSCISINDEVVHGVPKNSRFLADGDLVKIDVCAAFKGYCADMTRSYFVNIHKNARLKKLTIVAQAALDKGIAAAVVGGRLSDISFAIQSEVERSHFGVVRDFAGHGIGKQMHEDPEILNYGRPGEGPVLRSGMVFALEPMITMGSYQVYVDADGWTVKTIDKSYATHVEDTIIITKDGPEVVTRRTGLL